MRLRFVLSDSEPARIDQVLLRELSRNKAFETLTRSQIKNWIEAGRVTAGGRIAVKAGLLVAAPCEVEVELPEPENQSVAYDFKLSVVFEDESLIVIDKPAGLSMHPGAGNKSRTLLNALIGYFGAHAPGGLPEVLALAEKQQSTLADASQPFRPGIVHRLDKDTSGVVVIAKTVAVHYALARQFADRAVSRVYKALVLSTPRANRLINSVDAGRVDTCLGRHPGDRKSMAVRESGGKRAITNFTVLERMSYACLLALRLETGRTHQIRVHMNHIGSPVIGDRRYGDFSALPLALRRAQHEFGRQALHAESLEFTHPLDGKRLSFSSSIPPDMEGLISTFRSFDVRKQLD